MVLCLLVYNLAQRQLSLALALAQDTIPNQLGKPSNSPTLRPAILIMKPILVFPAPAALETPKSVS
jgi:hypothetical protein